MLQQKCIMYSHATPLSMIPTHITVVNCTVGVFIYLKASNPAFGICIAVFGCGAFLFILYHLNYNFIPLIVDGNTEGNYIGLMLNLLLVYSC